MSGFSASSWITAWTLSWFGVLLSAVLLLGYVALLAVARRGGVRWPWWRVASYLLLGVGTLVYVTCGAVGAYRETFFWMFAAQVTTLSAVTPVGLAIGDPVGLLTAVRGRDTVVHRMLHSGLARVLMFPVLSSVVGVASMILLFYTGYAQAATRSAFVGGLANAQMLVVGGLVVLPLVTDDLLPEWATDGVRTLLAVIDGFFDAIPAILLMTATSLLAPRFPGFASGAAAARNGMDHLLDQQYAGGTLLVIAELVGLPLMGVTFAQWLRSDAQEAHVIDARLDAATQPARVADQAGADAPSYEEPALEEPWWLSDPRLADRYGHRRTSTPE